MKKLVFGLLAALFVAGKVCSASAQPLTSRSSETSSPSAFRIARLQYDGGGDWYNGPLEEPTLLKFVKDFTKLDVSANYHFADINSDEIFSYPFLFLTGHGNIHFTDAQAGRLRRYLNDGGFLYADDDYGMNDSFIREIRRVFPEKS
ncbi:MAG: DUF4159 domain-containing protein, partial [Bacteroidetes bacterium]|nr:DUF4159 domain-containing protein [Bacteroidota bacterium]